MPIVRINDANDDRIQHYANLRSDARRGSSPESFVVEGRWCVQRFLDSSLSPLSLLVERSKEAEVATWVPSDVPVYSLPTTQIQDLVGFPFHRGVLACGRRPECLCASSLEFSARQLPLALAMLGVSELENVGSMIRTATAMGIEHLIIDPRTADPFSRRVIRVSMATVFTQQLYRLTDSLVQLVELQKQGIRTIVTTLDPAATPLDQFVPDRRPAILLVGNEAEGIDREIQETATDRVTIPMQLGTDSFNVAVAAAIFMYSIASRLSTDSPT